MVKPKLYFPRFFPFQVYSLRNTPLSGRLSVRTSTDMVQVPILQQHQQMEQKLPFNQRKIWKRASNPKTPKILRPMTILTKSEKIRETNLRVHHRMRRSNLQNLRDSFFAFFFLARGVLIYFALRSWFIVIIAFGLLVNANPVYAWE